MNKEERNKFLNALIYPVIFVLILCLLHFIQYAFEFKINNFGIYPRNLSGLKGILFSPLIHADYQHLLSNSIPLLILGAALFFFYKKIALKVVLWIYLMVGVWTWVSAREAYHIGASGLLYGIFSFLLVSGFLRKNKQLIAVSFFVIMFYGGMVWGIFPIKINISFEGHLWGFIAGIVLALYYRKQGVQKEEFLWEGEDDDEDDENAYWKVDSKPKISTRKTTINYIFKPKKSPNNE